MILRIMFIDPSGNKWNKFFHLEGKIRMIIEGEDFIAEPGKEVFIPVSVGHSVENIHHATTTWLYGFD